MLTSAFSALGQGIKWLFLHPGGWWTLALILARFSFGDSAFNAYWAGALVTAICFFIHSGMIKPDWRIERRKRDM